MKNYLTMSRLVLTEGLGSQMGNFAAMYAITRVTGHRILFLDSWTAGKGLLLNVPFEGLPIDLVSEKSMTLEERTAHTFDLDTECVVDPRVFELDSNLNYDFKGNFNSYRYWYPARAEILNLFRFRKEIAESAASLIDGAKSNGRELVSIHVRRTDYLISPNHVHLSLDYYLSACSQFKGDQYTFLVFSDDVDWCKSVFSRRKNFAYSTQGSPYVDMCAMSLCNHNIIANSAFSFWGALLNRNRAKKIVCPGKFLTEQEGPRARYVNYAWFPDEWISLQDLLA